jgi:hypothetical protein
MNVEITYWVGGLGNKILALFHGLIYALGTNTNLIIPYDDTGFITSRFIQLQDASSNKILCSANFFEISRDIPNGIEIVSNTMLRKKAKILLKQNINMPSPSIALNYDDLVIYIRSGDIMVYNSTGNAPEYIPPPLVYYTTIINQYKWKNIYLICEDAKHPCMRELGRRFPYIIWKKQSLKKDIAVLLAAKTLIIGGGTFIPALLFFSNNIQNLYCTTVSPQPFLLELQPNIKIIYLNYKNYFIKQGNKWRCTPQQLQYMLNYTTFVKVHPRFKKSLLF